MGLPLHRWFAELRRRRVLRVAGVYLVCAWVAIQVAATIFPYLQLPGWTVTAVIVVAILGLPLALALAWLFDITPDGAAGGTDALPEVHRRAGARLPLSLGLVLVVSTAGWLWLRTYMPPPARADTVLILPFQVSGNAEYAYLGDGLIDLIGRNLEGSAGLRAIDPHTSVRIGQHDVQDGPLDGERGRRLARATGARLFLLGTVTEHAGELALSARLYDQNQPATPLQTLTASGPASELFALVDRLTRELLASRFGAASAKVTSLAARGTESLNALKEFLRAEQALRAARYDSAIARLQRAVAIDSTFALGYYRLAVAGALQHTPGVTNHALQRALRYAERLGAHDRRLLGAFAALWDGRVEEAEAAYRSLLEDFPDDLEARVQLGGLLVLYNPLRGRPADEAWTHLAQVSALDPAYVCPVCTMVNLSLEDRDVARADSLMRVRYGDDPLSTYRAGIAAALRDTSGFRRWAAITQVPGYWQAAWSAAFFGNYEGAEWLLRMRPLESLAERDRAVVHFALADLYAAQLRWRAAERELTRAAVLVPERTLLRRAYLTLLPFLGLPDAAVEEVLADLEQQHAGAGAVHVDASFRRFLPLLQPYFIGLAHSRLGRDDAALAAASDLEGEAATSGAPTLARDLAHVVRADVALRSEQPARALAHLDSLQVEVPFEILDAVASSRARNELADPLTLDYARYLRIQALLLTSRPREALRWAENGFFRIGGNPLYALELQFLRAEALSALSAHDSAGVHYAAYIAGTADADADLRARPRHAAVRARAVADREE